MGRVLSAAMMMEKVRGVCAPDAFEAFGIMRDACAC